MSLAAGAAFLGAVGHLANLGQFVEIGQGHAYQREQMAWARRAYCLDSRALRIDLLNAVKEDVRDHHQTYAGRIDTLLLVHTLLLTFALATLQYSDQFVPSSQCAECEESLHPWLVIAWVYAVSAILILPFWSLVMLIWSKLQLDRWLENSLGRLNLELRRSLSVHSGPPGGAGGDGGSADPDSLDLLERVEGAVNRLSGFVVEHQDSFKRVWGRECRMMIRAATVFLWVSCVLAILITAGMFWLFLENHMEGAHRSAASHFAACTLLGLLAPAGYALTVGGPFADQDLEESTEVFKDCIESPVFLAALRAENGEEETVAGGSATQPSLLRAAGHRLGQVAHLPVGLLSWAYRRRRRQGQLEDRGLAARSAREPFAPEGWAPLGDDGRGVSLMEWQQQMRPHAAAAAGPVGGAAGAAPWERPGAKLVDADIGK